MEAVTMLLQRLRAITAATIGGHSWGSAQQLELTEPRRGVALLSRADKRAMLRDHAEQDRLDWRRRGGQAPWSGGGGRANRRDLSVS